MFTSFCSAPNTSISKKLRTACKVVTTIKIVFKKPKAKFNPTPSTLAPLAAPFNPLPNSIEALEDFSNCRLTNSLVFFKALVLPSDIAISLF